MNTNEPCAAVFPVDEDFMRLPNNDVIQLEGRQQKITYYLTLGGWNISSPNHIINVIDKFDFSQLDVLVLVNSYHFLEHRVIEDIIRIAAQNNIEIYWARDDRDVDRQAIEEMSDELKVCTSFICNEVAADISTVLHNFDIPIVSIAGVAIYMLISALNIIKEKVRVEIVAKVQYSLWHQAYEHLMRMKINYFDDRNAAEIFNNLSVDIANMVSVADESAFFVVTQAFSMVGGVIGLFILDYRMTILVLLFIPIKAVVMKYFAKYRKKVMDEFILDSEKYSSCFSSNSLCFPRRIFQCYSKSFRKLSVTL